MESAGDHRELAVSASDDRQHLRLMEMIDFALMLFDHLTSPMHLQVVDALAEPDSMGFAGLEHNSSPKCGEKCENMSR